MTGYAVEKGEFGWAVEHLKNGRKIRRAVWGAETHVYVDPNGSIRNNRHEFENLLGSDLLADDWELVEEDRAR